MAIMRIEFNKGGIFTSRFLEKEAPKTCEVIKKHLPFELQFHHSIVSGQAIVAYPNNLSVVREHQQVAGISAGAICFLVKDEPLCIPDEIYISYGLFISRSLKLDIKQPVNVFAQIENNFDHLKEIGQRILREGSEIVKFSSLEN
jgi:hypothetical protein